MMKLKWLVCWALLLVGTVPLVADESSEFPDPDQVADWSVVIRPEQIFKLDSIDQVINVITEGEAAELKRLVARYQEVVGLDPTSDVREIRLDSSANFIELVDHGPEALVSNSVVSAVLKTTGNLEGLVLVAPGYDTVESKTRGTLHRFELEDEPVFVHFGTADDTGSVVAGFNDSLVTHVVSEQGKSPSDTNRSSDDGGLLAKCWFSAAAIRKVVRMEEWEENSDDATDVIHRILSKTERISADVSSDGDKVRVQLDITTNDANGAKQLHQLAKAGAAMLKVAIAEEGDDSSELRTILKLADSIQLQSKGKELHASVEIEEIPAVLQVLSEL